MSNQIAKIYSKKTTWKKFKPCNFIFSYDEVEIMKKFYLISNEDRKNK